MDFNQLTFWWTNLTQRQQISVGAVVILVAYLVFRALGGQFGVRSSENTTKNTPLVTQWKNQGLAGFGNMNPADRLGDLVTVFGRPAVFDPSPGGLAVWKKNQLTGWPFNRVEIRDELIPHNSPKPHTDFLYTWYSIDVPKHKVDGLIRISQSITYDPLKKEMRARCHDLRPNVVTHWIVKQYAEDRLTLDEAAGMYGPMIMELFEDDTGGVKYQQLLSEI